MDNIKFVNFWRKDKDIRNTDIGNFFLSLIKNYYFLKKDVVIFSCFGDINSNLKTYKNEFKILYLGENPRNRGINDSMKFYNNFDVIFSYEKNIDNKYNFKHIRFTNWMFDLFNYFKWHKTLMLPNKKEFFSKILKYYNVSDNKTFVNMSRHGQGKRTDICNDLSNLNIKIDYTGKWRNNVLQCKTEGNHRVHKFNYLKKYTYNICPENSMYDGYCTEKLFDALITGCIPIYWGDTIDDKYFNKEKILYYDSNFIKNLNKMNNNINEYLKLNPFSNNFYENIKIKELELKKIFM